MDLDGDGHLDVISGSWPGELYHFRGGPGRSFSPAVKLKYKDGKTINIGGGLRKDVGGDMILVAGDAKYEKDAKGRTVILYDGERIEIPEGKEGGITGTASTVHATDWDGDGDLDLLVGEIGGKVYFVPNEGGRKALAFGKEQQIKAGGKPIQAPGGDAGPFVADWDGDGKADLLVGCGDGSVWLYRNVGKAKAPELAPGVGLVAKGRGYGDDMPRGPARGTRAKVCVADWDGDGRLDLLLGDVSYQKPVLPEPTPEQKAEHAKLRKEQQELNGRFSALYQKLSGPKRVTDAKERAAVEKELTEVNRRQSEIYRLLPREYEHHGWVWFFRRQPAALNPAGAKAVSQ